MSGGRREASRQPFSKTLFDRIFLTAKCLHLA